MKSKKRIEQNAEVFTPAWLVEEMLDKLPEETWQEGKTFLDNSCGDGNFLVAVLARKLQKGHDPLAALKTIYGVDIMQDNVQECRRRLLATLVTVGVKVSEKHNRAVRINVKWLSPKKYKRGSLDYDFSFNEPPG